MVWQWGAILATVLAMTGAIVLTLPMAMAYRWTKPAHEYDSSVMHSSIILAPTVAGILIVIQGSLAMAFSLAGVATAVRFRNSLKDTNDAVYVFVAVAIGLAAGVQALDIALVISLIFSAAVVLLSRSPFRYPGGTQQAGHGHHHHHRDDGAAHRTRISGHGRPRRDGGSRRSRRDRWTRCPTTSGGSRSEPADTSIARPVVESVLDRETKRWRLERLAPDASGAVGLVYAVRGRKRMPYAQLLAELRAAAGSGRFRVEATAAPGASPPPAA